jgi:hypothetical protein
MSRRLISNMNISIFEVKLQVSIYMANPKLQTPNPNNNTEVIIIILPPLLSPLPLYPSPLFSQSQSHTTPNTTLFDTYLLYIPSFHSFFPPSCAI